MRREGAFLGILGDGCHVARGRGRKTPRQVRYWNYSNEFIFLPKSIHADPTGLDSSEILSDMSVTPPS